jgi:ABC-type lipoprotein release transport system permease subunit
MLYGVGPHDPLAFVTVVALLVLVALGASWLPARRATRTDLMVALRAD